MKLKRPIEMLGWQYCRTALASYRIPLLDARPHRPYSFCLAALPSPPKLINADVALSLSDEKLEHNYILVFFSSTK